jgi:hypothetical protein
MKAWMAATAAWVTFTLPAGAQCVPKVEQHPIEGAQHVTPCAPTPYNTNPPSSGNHYSVWAAFQTYDVPVAPGFLVHDLEHGAIVVGYNCPSGCASEVAALQAWINRRPVDPLCEGFSARRRIILAPNPALDVRFAAAAWGWTWKAGCADTASLQAFTNAHYAHGPEDLCGGGDPTAPTICPVAAVLPAPEARGQVTPELRRLWAGSLARRAALRIEAAGADGRLIESSETPAGPGAAEAVWDAAAFRRRHAGAGAVAVKVTLDGAAMAALVDYP